MKCMCVPANLSADEWYRLAARQCEYLRKPVSPTWREDFNDGLSVNEAVALWPFAPDANQSK